MNICNVIGHRNKKIQLSLITLRDACGSITWFI